MVKEYADIAIQKAVEMLAIDSPSGFTKEAIEWTKKEFEELGFETTPTNKGGIIIDFGGEDSDNGLFFEAHADTIGGMVSEIKSNGRLKIAKLGGLNPNNTEAENVRIYTRDGKIYEGTYQLNNASCHVNLEYNCLRTFDNMEIVIDEDVRNAEETRKLGIEVGDMVCFDPRTRVTESGYIKSRHLDDKLLVGILLAFAKYIKDKNITLKRRTYAHITVYEEVGHGGSSSVPDGITEAISLDMSCVGEGITCTEKQVSICAKDSKGPYNYEVTTKLINAAKREGADYAIDVYPRYGSDVEMTLYAGHDVRHGLIGPGVYASHGYERSHIDGACNTLKVIKGYLEI